MSGKATSHRMYEPPHPFQGKHVVLIGTGRVERQRVLHALRALGLGRITCVHDRPNWAAPYVDDWIYADPAHPSPATIDLVCACVSRPDGVFTYDDDSVVLAAHIARALRVVGIAPEAAERAKDKDAFRRLCVERELPAPRFCRVDPAEGYGLDATLGDAGVRFPVVVRHAHGAGSGFALRADHRDELDRTLARFATALARAPAAAPWPNRTVLIEEYLEGSEAGIDLLLQDGELRYSAVTDHLAPESAFGEEGRRIPSALPQAAQRELVEMAIAVLGALGVGDGCVHVEAQWTARGPVPIGVNLCLGSAEAFELNLDAHSMNLVEAAVRVALRLPWAPHPTMLPR
jgi:biotin carboxylase